MAKTPLSERIKTTRDKLRQLEEQERRLEARRKSDEAKKRRSLETKVKVLVGVGVMAYMKKAPQSDGAKILQIAMTSLEAKDRAILLQWPDFEPLIEVA